MKVDDAKKWVSALRSGDYKQCTGYLKSNGGFCCLGVLQEINPDLDLKGGCTVGLNNYDKIGLPSAEGKLFYDFINRSDNKRSFLHLSGLNDGTGLEKGLEALTFDEIADVIQAEYVLKVM